MLSTPIDRAALLAGSIRLASGVSFLVDPVRANRLWGDRGEPAPTTRLLLRSMGYRDALGGLLVAAAVRRRDTRGWFLASGGADAADLLGGLSVHHEMTRSQHAIGLGVSPYQWWMPAPSRRGLARRRHARRLGVFEVSATPPGRDLGGVRRRQG